MDLYHADIRLPEGFALPPRTVRLSWTRHALHAAENDRYGYIPQFYDLDLRHCKVIEVGMIGRRVEKVVVRWSYDSWDDIVFVLIPQALNPWVVKTVWINKANDTHKTLDRSRYVC